MRKISDFFKKKLHFPNEKLTDSESLVRYIKSNLFYVSSSDCAEDKMKIGIRTCISLLQFIFSLIEAIFKLELLSRAAALTLYTLLSAVPFFALVILGLMAAGKNEIETNLLNIFYFVQPDIQLNTLITFSKQLIDYLNSKEFPYYSGLFGCGIVLFYTAYNFYGDIDSNFNKMWQTKNRSIGWKILHTCCWVILCIILVYFFGNDSVSSIIEKINGSGCSRFLISFLSIWSILCIAFWLIPNTKVKFRSAAISSCIAALLIVLIELLMIHWDTQKYNAVYDHLATLFLIIVFLQFTWIIVLCGVSMTARIDNQDASYLETQCEALSPTYRRFISIMIASYIYSNYRKCDGAEKGVTIEDIRMKMFMGSDNRNRFLPNILIFSIMKELEEKHIIASIDKKIPKMGSKWRPYCPEEYEGYTVGDMLFALDFSGNYDLKYRYEDALLQKWGWDNMVIPILKTYAEQKVLLKDIEIKPDINIIASDDKARQKESCKVLFEYYQDSNLPIEELGKRNRLSQDRRNHNKKIIRLFKTMGNLHVIKILNTVKNSRKKSI